MTTPYKIHRVSHIISESSDTAPNYTSLPCYAMSSLATTNTLPNHFCAALFFCPLLPHHSSIADLSTFFKTSFPSKNPYIEPTHLPPTANQIITPLDIHSIFGAIPVHLTYSLFSPSYYQQAIQTPICCLSQFLLHIIPTFVPKPLPESNGDSFFDDKANVPPPASFHIGLGQLKSLPTPPHPLMVPLGLGIGF